MNTFKQFRREAPEWSGVKFFGLVTYLRLIISPGTAQFFTVILGLLMFALPIHLRMKYYQGKTDALFACVAADHFEKIIVYEAKYTDHHWHLTDGPYYCTEVVDANKWIRQHGLEPPDKWDIRTFGDGIPSGDTDHGVYMDVLFKRGKETYYHTVGAHGNMPIVVDDERIQQLTNPQAYKQELAEMFERG